MTEDDKAALKEFMRGVAVTIGVTGIIMLGVAILSNNDVPIDKPFAEVVGQYKECDIIRWTNNQLAEYKYFLYCGENK